MSLAIAARACLIGLLLAGAGAHAADEFWAYRIQPGDTLIGICGRWLNPNADWRELRRINRIANVRRLVPGSVLQVPLAMLREQNLVAEVLHAHGSVSVQRAGLAPQALAGGANLSVGEVVRTGPQSSASLRFADGSRVLLRPDSELRIDRMARLGSTDAVDTRLQLVQGSADTRVPKQKAPRFEIRTPMAHLGVRGTEFRTRAQPAFTAVEVLDGRVAGSSPTTAPRVVDAGFGALASAQGVTVPSPLLAAPDLQAVPTRVERLPLRLAWPGRAGPASYRAQVFDAGDADRLVLDGLFDAAGARWSDDLPDGRYRLQVRAVDANGLEGLDASTTFTLKARPEPPFATRPQAAARTADEAVRLAWTRSAGASRYRLQVADVADAAGFSAPRIDRDDLTGTEHVVSLPLGTHQWRIASIRADGDIGPWSDPLSFTRVALPPPPDPLAPRWTSEGVVLMWRASPGVRYQLQVARDAAFAPLLHDERLDAAQWLLHQPEPGRYFIRVRTIDADGFVGPFGAVQDVEVSGSRWWLLLLPAALLLL